MNRWLTGYVAGWLVMHLYSVRSDDEWEEEEKWDENCPGSSSWLHYDDDGEFNNMEPGGAAVQCYTSIRTAATK